MSSEVLIKVENVSKKFCRDLKRSLWYGLSDITGEITGRNNHNRDLRQKEFWALNDISFELKRGEVLGLIGRNGAGKTTLLKVLNNLIKPDTGRVTMRGRVSALIALGAGFNPILTGRENIYVNGAVLGLTKKEIDAKFDEIVDFAELWDFIDTPVQSYSSGMLVRLGFAVATALKPDVLLLDEILAVGDLKFRIKCYRKMDEIRENAAMIFVSHSLEQIGRICSSALVLDKGKILHYGDVSQGLQLYNSLDSCGSYDAAMEHFYPIKSCMISASKKVINYGDDLIITFEIDSEESIESTFRLIFFEYPSRIVAGEVHGRGLGLSSFLVNRGENKFSIKIPALYLKSGEYAIGYNLLDVNRKLLSAGDGHILISLKGSGFGEIHNQIPARIEENEDMP
jgi:lipopolysaccharide transport system ATP-binding protein